MDYIAQLNGFWQWRRQNKLSNSASMMYMALLHFAEQSHTENIAVQNSELQLLTGIGKNGIYDCRKELEEAGLITFLKGNGAKTPVYCIKEVPVSIPDLGNRSELPIPDLGNSPEAPIPDLGNSSDTPIHFLGNRSGENGVSIPDLGNRSELPTNMYINNNNNIYINNNTNTNNTKLLQVYTKQTEDEEKVNQKKCLDFFECNIRPIGSAFEGENLIELIKEFGNEAFKGAVLLAKKNSVNNGSTWKWMQTVLANGDWKYGYEERSKKKRRARIPSLDIVGLLESG
ncbi:MAG: hypothetical protein IJ963_05750 [Phascolarctobacterium sp.]|nr:hypothetical protein [Phascolarctobacterium sp.]MBR6636899.1 hypothetical protein [Phascolarctobacterium sp.]